MNFQCTSAFVTLAAVDFNKLVLFYSQLLTIQPQLYIPNRYAEFLLPSLRLGIFQPKQTHQVEFRHGKSAISVCLEVADIGHAIAHLTNLGYPPPGEILTASHGKEIYAYDPEENRLILHQSL